jgi:hypothetical protein
MLEVRFRDDPRIAAKKTSLQTLFLSPIPPALKRTLVSLAAPVFVLHLSRIAS